MDDHLQQTLLEVEARWRSERRWTRLRRWWTADRRYHLGTALMIVGFGGSLWLCACFLLGLLVGWIP